MTTEQSAAGNVNGTKTITTMKIKPSINKNVTMAVENCHEVIVNETINLLKLIGAERGKDVPLRRVLFLFQHNGNVTETVICSSIAYCDSGSTGYYLLSMGSENHYPYQSSDYLSLSNLLIIYEEVRRVVREYQK